MARYIDADALRKRMFSYYGCINENTAKENYRGVTLMDYEVANLIEDCIDDAPTADVVPKSEVERLHEALSKAEADVKNYMKVAEYQQSLSVKRYHEIKRLKEDIERLEDINERDVENLRLAKAEVAREIFEEIEKAHDECIWVDITTRIGYLQQTKFEQKLAELKKKYTEEKT